MLPCLHKCVCHALLQVNSRYWGFRNESEGATEESPLIVTLAPLLDMADHAEGETRSLSSIFGNSGNPLTCRWRR